MAYNINFNGFDLNTLAKIQKVTRPIMAERETKTIEIPNKDGGHLQHVRHKPKNIPVDIAIIGNNHSEIRANARVLGAILNKKQPVPIIFSDEPHLTYYGIVSGNTDLEQISVLGKGTITFHFPDPHGYEAERKIVVQDPTLIIQNDASADVYPIVKATFKKQATFFALADPDRNVVLIGNPDNPTVSKVNPEELVMWDQFDNISVWQPGQFTQINGTPRGTMKSNGYQFQVDSWGTSPGPNQWYGPTMKRSLPQPLADFRIDALVTMEGDWNPMGRIELYLLDINNKVIGKMAMVDNYSYWAGGTGEVIAGDVMTNRHVLISHYSPHWWHFNEGLLRIGRIGTYWWAYICLFDKTTGREHTGYFRDVVWTGDDTGDLAQILIHIGGIEGYGAPWMAFDDLKVFKMNNVDPNYIPQIFQAGDILEIDYFTGIIRKNGEIWMDYLDAGSKFFGIPNGTTELAYMPNDLSVVDVEVTYKPRWI